MFMEPAELQGLSQRRRHQFGLPDDERWDSDLRLRLRASTQPSTSTTTAQGKQAMTVSELGRPHSPLDSGAGESEVGAGEAQCILSEVTVRAAASLDSEIVGSLSSGMLANVVGVAELKSETRTRAYIDRPVTGWISLKTKAGETLAERMMGDNDGYEQEYEEGALRCWICHGDDILENLISPCACKGTQQVVHNECLVQWLHVKVDRRTAGSALQCDICQVPYEIVRGKLAWQDIFKMAGFGIMMVMFSSYVCCIAYFKCYKLVWMKGSLGGSWVSTLMTGLLGLYNIHMIGSQMFRGIHAFWSEMRRLNCKRVRVVQSRQ